MQKLLSICIPTFNRAQELDRQLEWLSQEVIGFEQSCEVIISDNCSTDETQSVISRWETAFHSAQFRSYRHDRNIGGIKNFAYCLETASGIYTWIVGDDDRVRVGTLAFLMQTLHEQSNLSLLYLNFSGRMAQTGEIIGEHWFHPSLANGLLNGKPLFQQCIQQNFGSVIFITAIVFRTETAAIASQIWPCSLDNWAGVAIWTAYCATQGNMLITQENFIECIIGVSHWQNESRIHFKTRYQDTPEVYLCLQEMGYSRSFCRHMILEIMREDFTSIRFIRSLIGSILVKPKWSINVVKAFLLSLYHCLFVWDSQNIAKEQSDLAIASSSKIKY